MTVNLFECEKKQTKAATVACRYHPLCYNAYNIATQLMYEHVSLASDVQNIVIKRTKTVTVACRYH